MKIEPRKMLDQIDAKIAATSNPRHQSMLKNFREHVAAELDGRDLNRIMRTLVPEPQYHWWGMGLGDVGPKGKAAVEAHYRQMLDEGFNLHQHELNRIVVDDTNIFLDGPIHIVFPGKALKNMGFPVEDIDAFYLFSYHAWALFQYDDSGKFTCEDSYMDGAMTMERLKKLKPEEVPEPIRA